MPSRRWSRLEQPEPTITHLPLMWLADCEPHGTLIGHFARANAHVQRAEAAESIAIFHGPHAYVSPSLYADPAASVPTWNYAVVHAHGPITLSADRAGTQAILDMLIHRFESTRAAPWQLGLDPARLDAMVGAIVGFRMRIKRIDAKFKLSQNRSDDDRARVMRGARRRRVSRSVRNRGMDARLRRADTTTKR